MVETCGKNTLKHNLWQRTITSHSALANGDIIKNTLHHLSTINNIFNTLRCFTLRLCCLWFWICRTMLLSRTERELSRTGREVCKEKNDKLLRQKLQHKMIVSIDKCTCEIVKNIN